MLSHFRGFTSTHLNPVYSENIKAFFTSKFKHGVFMSCRYSPDSKISLTFLLAFDLEAKLLAGLSLK